MEDKFKFGQLKKNIEQMKRELPVILANDAQNFFVGTFYKQGWDGQGWETPQRKMPGTKAYMYPKLKDLGRRTRATLVKTGRLRRAVSMSIRSQTFTSVRLTVDLPYAAAQNEGLGNLPKREFMGRSPILLEQHREKIKTYMSRLWEK